MKIVVAIGGNMISDAKNKGEPFSAQLQRTQSTAEIIADLLELGHELVLTHGNGPQVGSLLLQQQIENNYTTSLPLYILGALTQGQIGVMLQHALQNELQKRKISKSVVVIPTTVIVDENDPAFDSPTKPVGPFFSEEEYQAITNSISRNPNRQIMTYEKLSQGYRRVVPSPKPIEILEGDLIDELSKERIIISVGGGGSPTIIQNGELTLVDAVIDKDYASALLAERVNADQLMILTNIDGVYKDFGKENQKHILTLTVDEALSLLNNGEFGRGSMAPKILAAINFSKFGDTIITSPEKILDSIENKAGTRILKQK